MKTIYSTAALLCAFAAGSAVAKSTAAPTADVQSIVSSPAFQRTLLTAQIADLKTTNLINWKVGDFHKQKVEFVFGGGDGYKEATKEDTARNAIWLKSDMTLLGQNQTTEALISRADGSVLELIVNGEKQDPNANQGEIEIVEQGETSVTVPAGTFECIYIKANVKQQGQEMVVEMWANPIDVNLDGSLKMIANTQFGALTISLTEFGSK